MTLINQLEDKISKAENINADEKEHIENLKIKIEKDEINFINEVFKIILDKKIEISHLTILSNEKISKKIFIIDFENKNENEIKSYIEFIEQNRNKILMNNLITKFGDEISKAENINEDEKKYIKNLKIKIEEEKINFIFEAFKIALNHENKIDDKAFVFHIKDIKKHFTFPLKATS